MAAQDLQIGTIVVPNPQFDSSTNAQFVNESYGFSFRIADTFQTLSTNNPNNYDVIKGLLFVPDIGNSSACGSQSPSLFPANITRRYDFPPGNYPFVAIAPWTTVACVQTYLSLMRADAVRAAIFYQPGNSTGLPPPVTDPSWNLQDGGRWKSDNQYPIYALPGAVGTSLLQELALYSGNMSSAPFGDELVELYDPHDSVRLSALIDINNTAGIPSLWVFLIIVLAILLAIVLITSAIMHIIQRRQRTLLRRRVANGEVDLEALGIKRLNVPQDILDKMPKYVFTSKGEGLAAVDKSTTPVREVPFSQPVCPICLEDFVHGETTIRELPCNHIFHPECIDSFLRDSSSLCPMCKTSALPVGYCPVVVTNLMVRRERLIRRMRERTNSRNQPPSGRIPAAFSSLQQRVRALSTPMVPSHSDMNTVSAETPGAEMRPMRRMTMGLGPVPPEVLSQGRPAVRAWRREQLVAQQARRYDEQANATRAVDVSRPLWRRIAGRVVPSLE